MNAEIPTIIDRIDTALDTTGAIVAEVTSAHLTRPSLCEDWDVAFELNHLVGGLNLFAAELTGNETGRDHHDDWLGGDHRAAFTAAADLDREAWSGADVLDTTVRLGFGIVPGPMAALIHLTEILVHGIDLAVVTAQQHLIDEQQAEYLLTTMRSMDFDAFRRTGMFGPQQPSPADALAHQRLLAFLGRRRLH